MKYENNITCLLNIIPNVMLCGSPKVLFFVSDLSLLAEFDGKFGQYIYNPIIFRF